jgi:hypothetical protein
VLVLVIAWTSCSGASPAPSEPLAPPVCPAPPTVKTVRDESGASVLPGHWCYTEADFDRLADWVADVSRACGP